jgi:integrase
VPNFTDLSIQKFPEGTHFDEKLKNFAIRVGKNRKTWIAIKGENRTKVTLGHYPAMSLAEARKSAMATLVSPTQGKSHISFPDAVEAFLALPRWRFHSKRVLTSSLKHFTWKRGIDRITHEDVVTALAAIQGTSARAHALKDIKTFFNWTIPRYLPASPCVGIKGEPQPSRSRVLSDDEIKVLWDACDGTFGIIFKLLLLTGQRKNEISLLRTEYIHDDLITLPQKLVKNGREHTFPIGPLAQSLLPKTVSGYLFTATKGTSHYNGHAYHLAKLQEETGTSGFSLHDLRRTFSTRMAELGTPIVVTEKLINHVSGTHTGVQAIYNRYSYLKEQREAVLLYEQYLAKLVGAEA